MPLAGALLLLAACGSGGDDVAGGGGGGGPSGGGGGSREGGRGTPLPVTPQLTVRNDHNLARTETVRASVPFSEGQHMDTANLGVSGLQTAWQVMQKWPDGSIRVAQAQFTDEVPGNTAKTYDVVGGVTPATGAFERNAWIDQLGVETRIGAQVRDTFGVNYRSVLAPLVSGEILEETPLVRVRRARGYHQPQGAVGIGRDYLTSTFYIHEFRDMPILVVDWIIGNDYQGKDGATVNDSPNMRPLGGVDVNDARFLVSGVSQCLPYKAAWHAIGAEAPSGTFRSFPVMADTFIDDGQTRRYQFVLRFEHPGADPVVRQRWRDTAQAMATEPMFALASLENWQRSMALGLHGGPVNGPSDARERCEGEYQSWVGRDDFGTWGTFGDVQVTATTGTPRNHPLTPELGHAIQGQHHRLLVKLQHMAWVQAVRPYHFWKLRVGAEDGVLLWDSPPVSRGSRDLSDESLGRRALINNDPYPGYRTRLAGSPKAHGWQAFDHEHWSSDLLFDYWTISGDPWAKEELRMLGECLKGLMRLSRFATANLQAARAEGWCMQGFVQSFLATGDQSLRTYALRRVNEIIEPARGKWHNSKAMTFQGNYPGTGYGPASHQFYMPWQHGAVLYGFLGAAYFFEDELCMKIAEDVVHCVDYAWVRNFNDPRFGTIADGLRYYVPTESGGQPVPPSHFDAIAGVGAKFGDSPLGGAHTFLTGGLMLLARDTRDAQVHALATEYGSKIHGSINNWSPNDRWNKWNMVVPQGIDPE